MEPIVSLTKDLIRFQTMQSRRDEISACADFIMRWLADRDLPARRIDHGGIPSVLAVPPKGSAEVLLMSHIDVVDGPEALFEPVERDGRLYGRGAVDDKYAAALSLVLLESHANRLREAGRSLDDLPVGVLITGDEEIGGVHGAKAVLPEVRADFCIALDGGAPGQIVTKEKGVLRVKLIGRGRTAHGARPWLGENAIENLMADFLKVKPLFDLEAPEHWHRTVNLGKISGGTSINQVPDRAEAILDIRYTENDDVDDLVARMREAIDGDLEVTEREPLFISKPTPFLDLLVECAEGAETVVEHGASDARFLSDLGIPGVVWGAESENSQHTEDEHVVIDSVTELHRMLDGYLTRVAERR